MFLVVFAHTKFHNKNIALTKTFASVANETSPIMVLRSETNDEIYAKKLWPVRRKTTTGRKKRKKKTATKANAKIFAITLQ